MLNPIDLRVSDLNIFIQCLNICAERLAALNFLHCVHCESSSTSISQVANTFEDRKAETNVDLVTELMACESRGSLGMHLQTSSYNLTTFIYLKESSLDDKSPRLRA
ncbi:hypothetical protein KC19_12G115800 [Ceratodon purpureus]|uniref:Uncharacterized protein n=1 Tax=Ceratodon purpureus TaxID=3225 RepID=A0A8T0G7C9_CERPU|nr:hypothetical protein KC19_12G115800 [Ceratodon purpureus]